MISGLFRLFDLFLISEFSTFFEKKCLLRKDFDLLPNSQPTVLMYADG